MTRRKGPLWYDGTWATVDENTGEEFTIWPFPVGPVKPSTLALVDRLAAEMRFRDRVWQENRDRLFREWRENKPTQTLAEFVDQTCEQIRRGK